MPTTKKNFSRTIKLGPAIGDWTKIEPNQRPIEAANIREIKQPNFDSLPQADVRYLHLMHYRMAENFLEKLGEDLNIKTELHSISATQLSGEDFKDYLDDPLIQFDLHLKSVGTLNFIIEPSLGEVLVNRMAGSVDPMANTGRPFTELDDSILAGQIEEFVPLFSKMWKSIFMPEHIHYQSHFGSYIFDDKFTNRDAYVFFGFYFTIGYSEVLRFIIAYPNSIIRKLLRFRKKVTSPITKRVQLLPKTLQSIQVPITAELGSSEIIMSDLKSLEAGDIITLDSKIEDAVKVMLGTSKSIMGQAGVSRNRVCVQLLNQEEIDDMQALDEMDKLVDEESKDLLPSHFTDKATQFTEELTNWDNAPQMIDSPVKGVVHAGADAALVDEKTDPFGSGEQTGMLFDDLGISEPTAGSADLFEDNTESDFGDMEDDIHDDVSVESPPDALLEANDALENEYDDAPLESNALPSGDENEFGFDMPDIPEEDLREQEEAMAMEETEMTEHEEVLPNSEGLQDLGDYDDEDEQTFGSAAQDIPSLGMDLEDDYQDEEGEHEELALPMEEVTAVPEATQMNIPPPVVDEGDDNSDDDDFSWDDLDD